MLPRALDLDSGAGLQLVDFRSVVKRTAAAAGGVCTAAFDPVDDGYLWLVQRMVVQCNSAGLTLAQVYVTDPATVLPDADVVDTSATGNLDVADEFSPILVESNRSLVVRWFGADNGAIGTARVQYQLVQRVSG